MKNTVTLVLLLPLATLLSGCAAQAQPVAATRAGHEPAPSLPAILDTPAPCPVTPTVAIPDSEVPSDSWADPIHSPAWYRSADGSILASASGDLHVGGNKFGWLRPAGARLAVAGRRLDSTGPSMGAWVPDGYRGHFQVSDLEFPTGGCWEIEARTDTSVLRFVTSVKGPLQLPAQVQSCQDLTEAVKLSSGIVVGKVTHSERDSQGYRWNTIDVGLVWKNPYGGAFTGVMHLQRPAEPDLKEGQTYLLFVQRDPFQTVCPNQTLAQVLDGKLVRLANSGDPLWTSDTLKAVENQISERARP